MWKVRKPDIAAIHAFDTCRAGLQNADLSARMAAIRDEIQRTEALFDAAATASTTHRFPESRHVGRVTGKEMENLYDRHMARAGSRGNTIYEALMLAPEHEICPFCGQRTVGTLDHILPKSAYSALAVTPLNLIPSCWDCNVLKGTVRANDVDKQWLNAYYDDVAGDRWLYAKIVIGSPAAAVFRVKAPAQWPPATAERVKHQFRKLRLPRLYASQAGRYLQNMRSALKQTHASGGQEAVQAELNKRYLSCVDSNVNSWEGALCEAAAADAWYCNGGFEA